MISDCFISQKERIFFIPNKLRFEVYLTKKGHILTQDELLIIINRECYYGFERPHKAFQFDLNSNRFR